MSTESTLEVHPRPQLARERWEDLGGLWGFAFDDDDRGLHEHWESLEAPFTRTILVPHPPESAASGVAATGEHPIVWYRRTFTARHKEGEELHLHLGAVDYEADVWVNGVHVVHHEGGHTPFSADVTDALGEGEQVLVVRAVDRPGNLHQPRGKQDWEDEPHRIWYSRTTGIWQPVWLEPVNPTHVSRVQWRPDLDVEAVHLDASLSRSDGPVTVAVTMSQHGVPLLAQTYTVTGTRLLCTLRLPVGTLALNAREVLWTPEHPNLLHVTLRVSRDGEVLDEVESYTALRSVGTHQGRFRLNRRPYFLRMVLAQNFWPESHLSPPTPSALRREVELAKELGFNGVRLHQKLEDPRFLYWCDRLGLAVWVEMPSAYAHSDQTARRLVLEWLDALERYNSHPSVVAWVPANESWGVPHVETSPQQQALLASLYHLTHAHDGTRPVIANDGWEFGVTDIMGIHDYTPSAQALTDAYGTRDALEDTLCRAQPGLRTLMLGREHTGEPVMLTEFGGTTYNPDDAQAWEGYGAVGSEEELFQRYLELVGALASSPVIAGYCYTQLTDTMQERNGLLYEDRTPKLPRAMVRWVNQQVAASIPAEAVSVAAGGGRRPLAEVRELLDAPRETW